MASRRDDDDDALAAAARALRSSPVATDADDVLAAATAALRDVAQAMPPEVAATRVRLMGSLEHRGHRRRKRVIVAAVLASLGTGTLSWAAATGRVQRMIAALTDPVEPLVAPPAPAPEPTSVATGGKRHARTATGDEPAVDEVAVAVEPAPEPDPALDPALEVDAITDALGPDAIASADRRFATTTTPDRIPVPDGAPVRAEPAPPPPAPRPRPPRHDRRPPPIVDDAVERDLYRRAHELNFHGGDAETTLAAWDRYLAERPTGRFALEARYNRALALIRLDRRDDARAALTPFADGTIEPAGYRQRDARALLAALDRDPPVTP